jgi:hypothetical protein
MNSLPDRSLPLASFLLYSLICLPGLSLAQQPPSEQLYITTVSNEILAVDCAAGTVGSRISEAGSNLKGLFVRDDIHIITCEHNQNGSVKIFNAQGARTTITAAISFPYAVTGDSSGSNLYVIRRHSGGPDELWRVPRDPACLAPADPIGCPNGGYLAPVRIDANVTAGGVETQLLADVKFVPSGPLKGGVVVLSENPPMLVHYADPTSCPADPPPGCEPSVIISPTQFSNAGVPQPTAVAFADDGKILVTDNSGIIVKFDLDGNNPVGFASGLGTLVGMSVGIQQAQSRVFVTVHPDQVRCLDGSGVEIPNSGVSGINPPTGVGLASAGAGVVEEGQPISLSALETTFNQVQTGGLAFAACQTADDPRQFDVVNGPSADLRLCVNPSSNPTQDPNCKNPNDSTQFGVDFGFPNKIPFYVRGFKRKLNAADDPPSGPETIRVCQVKTTAQVAGLTHDESDEESWLGYHPSCSSATPPQFFYTEEPPNAPLREGLFAINQTTVCNFDGDDRWGASLAAPSLNDQRPIDGPKRAVCKGKVKAQDGIAEWQFFNLCQEAKSTCAAHKNTLLDILSDAMTRFNQRNYPAARDLLRDFECQAQADDTNTCNTAELEGRAKAIKYQLCRLLGEPTGPTSSCIVTTCP